MAVPQQTPAAESRRLHRSAALHGLAVVVFGLLAFTGVGTLGSGARALGVPVLIVGAAGSMGALIIMVSVLRRSRGTARTQRAARIGMVVAAVVAVAVGVALAPAGWERGFVITVNALTGVLLALFAALAGERTAP
ncbi:hypothetical protein OHA21_11495 [Actinoplanes sp. NBC_00393]|uniref:hypothetical protein n=1 Tax=Actinoplanes sp. NBC_00393 TaxID=2975953 RepID=UPI002E1AFBC2